MGKRKAAAGEEEGAPRKKHKKSKHKKKAKSREESSRVVEAEPGGRPLTLKIKLGKKPSEDVDEREEEEEEEEEEEGSGAGDSLATPEQTWPQLTGGAVEEEASEGEEEAWLVAMEKGELDERGYIPRRPGATLTARQRAMLGSGGEQLLELPVAGKASKEVTEEMILKKTEKNRKRRQAAQRRKEKRKAETVRKLLEKQTKKKEEVKPATGRTGAVAYLHYVSSRDSASLSVAPGVNCPLLPQPQRKQPVVQTCAVAGCDRPRMYCDSSSGLPLCSLNCYRTLHCQHTDHQNTTS